jgi:hypothetical protein
MEAITTGNPSGRLELSIKKEIKTLELSIQSVDSFSKKREKQGE